MDWVVRLAKPEDAVQVGWVLCSAYGAGDFPPAVLAAITRPPMHLLGSGRYFVAAAAECLIGCGGWSPDPPPGVAGRQGVAHLRHFAVDAEREGKGVGRSLFLACLGQIRPTGATRLDVVSTPGAEPFYRALGFEALGPFDARIAGLAFPSVYMTRKLDD